MPPRSATLDPAIAKLSSTLGRMQRDIDQIKRNQRMHQLDFASIENGALSLYDLNGNLRSLLGTQQDGTWALQHFNGGNPLAPSAPVLASGINALYVGWNGAMGDGSAPLSDFAGVQVHVSATPSFTPSSQTLQGVLTSAGTWPVHNLTAGTTYYVLLVAVTTSGASTPSAYSSGTPASVVQLIPPGSISATQLGFQARSIGGITTTIQNTPPLNPQIGDLWYDGSNGFLLNTWNGAQWVPYQFGTNAIAVGSITAQLIAAGTIIAGAVDGTTITGAKFVATGTSGEILAYNGVPASGNLVLAVSPVAGSDSFGNSYFAGVTTYNGFGAVVNLLSTDHAAFFQYQNLGSSSQGSMILSVASASGTDPVTTASYSAGFQGIDPVFGDFMTSTGANIHLGIGTVITRSGQVSIQQAPTSSQNPYIKVDAPEETTATHMQMLLQGASPDGTQLGQCLLGQVSGSATLTPVTNAMMEVQGQVTGTSPILQLLAQAAAANSFGIEVTGDGFNRFRVDANGKITWGPGNLTQDTNLYRGAANLLQTDDPLALKNASAPGGAAGVSELYAVNGQLLTVNPQGLAQNVQTANQAAGNTNTVTGITFANLTSAVIPAADATAIGNTYKLRVFGFGTWGSTQQALTFGIRFGAAATNIIGSIQTIAATTFGVSASIQWVADITLMLASNPGLTTATWRANAVITVTSSAATITVCGGTGASDITLDGSIAETFGLSCEWASTTGAPTISKSFGQFERTS